MAKVAASAAPAGAPGGAEDAKAAQRSRRVRDVVILACAVDAADKALLPATFKALSEMMDAGPARLSVLAFAQSVSFSLALPVWGSLMQFYSPRELMTFGCVLWGLATLLLAAASSYEVHLALRLVAGAALASVAPVGQALICDVVPEEGRGWAFGLLQSVSSALTMVVSFWTTSIATSTVLGLQGWRVPHLLVAVLSFLTGAAVWQVVPQVAPVKAQRSWLAEQRRVVSAVVRKPSFVIMVSQGVTGSIPWNAFAFLTFFWQVSGYSDMEAGEISLMMGLGGVVGGMLGGWLGDSCARISPYSGRCAVAQASVLLGTISFLGLVHVPQGRYSFSLVSALSFTFGAVASWTPAAALRPISGALFEDSQDRAQVLALWIAVEGVVASICGAPLVGLLSEAFGFKLSHGHGASAQLPEDRAGSLRALRAALVGTSVVPWTLCFLAWVPMYWTYPRDHQRNPAAQQRRRARADGGRRGRPSSLGTGRASAPPCNRARKLSRLCTTCPLLIAFLLLLLLLAPFFAA